MRHYYPEDDEFATHIPCLELPSEYEPSDTEEDGRLSCSTMSSDLIPPVENNSSTLSADLTLPVETKETSPKQAGSVCSAKAKKPERNFYIPPGRRVCFFLKYFLNQLNCFSKQTTKLGCMISSGVSNSTVALCITRYFSIITICCVKQS